MDKFKGTGVALITPFNEDKSIDILALEKLVEYQIKNGIDYIVALGTTAEVATLNQHEQNTVKQTIIKANKGRIPLVLGMGSNNTMALVNELLTTDLEGFDAILSVSPYYNKPTQDGIYAHFEAVANASKLPLILYNVPGRTSSNMEVDTVVKLAQNFENIIGIKEAKGDIVQAMKLIAETPDDFLIISGDDIITLPMVLAGGAGVISVIAQGFPSEFSKMLNYGLHHEVEKAYDLHYKLAPMIDMIFEQGNPAGIKSVFVHKELCQNMLRLPLLPVNLNLSNRIKTYMEQAFK